MDIHSPSYQWYTPCGQLLAVAIGETGTLKATLHAQNGETSALSALAMAHLEQWYKAEQAYLSLTQGANERQHYVQTHMDKSNESHREAMRNGLSSYYDEIHRMRMNAANMKQVREVSLQRALVTADKDMMGARRPAHGHYAPVVALGRELKRSKIDY